MESEPSKVDDNIKEVTPNNDFHQSRSIFSDTKAKTRDGKLTEPVE